MKTIKNKQFILSKSDLDTIAIDFLLNIDSSLINVPQPIPIEEIIEAKLKLNLDFKRIDRDNLVLGLTTFSNGYLQVFNRDKDVEETIYVEKGTIIISSDLADDKCQEGRFRFTCAHEVSHWHLHRYKYEVDENQLGLFTNENKVKEIRCLNRNVESFFSRNDRFTTENDWVEWQADYLGGAILLPKKSFSKAFNDFLEEKSIREQVLYRGKKPDMERQLINELSKIYNVSRKAVEVRLGQLNLVKNEPKFQTGLI